MKRSIQERYERWSAANPRAISLLERFAVEAHYAGRRIGVKLLAERVRWELNVIINHTDDPFRMNNDFTSRIARDLIARHPKLEETLETRRLRAA